MQKGHKADTIIGYVGETEDDDNVRLTIFAGEEDYLVEMNTQGKKLMQALDSEVKATGEIKQDRDGRNILCITKFEIIDDDYTDENFDDEKYDDDDFDDGDSDDSDTHGYDKHNRDDWIE
jgi:hypothetical protein